MIECLNITEKLGKADEGISNLYLVIIYEFIII